MPLSDETDPNADRALNEAKPPDTGSDFLSEIGFEIGGADQLADFRTKFSESSISGDAREEFLKKQLPEIQIRIGTLLKTDSISFLFGAGASKDCGGVLISTIPIRVEQGLIRDGISGDQKARVRRWLRYFYEAAKMVNENDATIPTTREAIIQRRQIVNDDSPNPLEANYESVLSVLHHWRSALPERGGRLRISHNRTVDLNSTDLDECLRRATRSLARCCRLPVEGAEDGFETYKSFMRKVLTRPLNLKRTNVFTLNYDTLVEQAADAEGVVLIDGFVGNLKRVFRPESYDQDLYFPAETTEGRVHRHDRVLHLYKLHGSITWLALEPEFDNPYGLVAKAEGLEGNEAVVIYPTPTKFGEVLGMPYAELFRRFASSIVRPQSTLVVIGYGFGDKHVNAIIRQALAVPSLTLVIVSPNPRSDFVQTLRERKDQRVWILSGKELGTFSAFVDRALPDLRDEEVRRKVIKTYRALGFSPPVEEEGPADG